MVTRMNLNNYEIEQELHTEQTQTDSPSASHRDGEDPSLARFRANRLFTSGAAWYFSTREGRDQGPFISKEQAEKAISEYEKQGIHIGKTS